MTDKSTYSIIGGMNDYQRAAAETADPYRRASDMRMLRLFYTALGLAGEAGEVANKVKKVMRDDGAEITAGRREAIKDELGDVLWYVAMCAAEIDCDLGTVARENLEKLQHRHG